jgi:hypothetical protein
MYLSPFPVFGRSLTFSLCSSFQLTGCFVLFSFVQRVAVRSRCYTVAPSERA